MAQSIFNSIWNEKHSSNSTNSQKKIKSVSSQTSLPEAQISLQKKIGSASKFWVLMPVFLQFRGGFDSYDLHNVCENTWVLSVAFVIQLILKHMT